MNLKPEDLSNEQVEQALELLKQYCDENKLDVIKFTSNKKNIPLASKEIYKKLPFYIKTILKEPKIESLLHEHHDYIKKQVKQKFKKLGV